MSFAVKLNSITSKVEINNVLIREAEVKVHTHPLLIKPENTVIDIQEESEWQLSKDKKLLLCFITRKLQGLQEKDGNSSSIAVEISVLHCVQYTVQEESELDENFLRVFCETNAVYNSYPYYREFIHSTCSKIGMAPLVLELLKPFTVKQLKEKYSDLIDEAEGEKSKA